MVDDIFWADNGCAQNAPKIEPFGYSHGRKRHHIKNSSFSFPTPNSQLCLPVVLPVRTPCRTMRQV